MKKRIVPAVVLLVAFVAIGMALYYVSQPKPGGGSSSFGERHSEKDTLMINGRHCGYVNLDKFITLVTKARNSGFDRARDVRFEEDSVFIAVRNKTLFYGIDDGSFWVYRYSNTPINVTEEGFKADVETIDSVRYIYIPYQILTSVANYVGESEERGERE